MTVLDIDLDFFVTPIKCWGDSNDRLNSKEYSVEDTQSALDFLYDRCGLPRDGLIPGAIFEHHDELFDYATANWKEPVQLIHVDAHADIGGGLTRCWNYVCTEFTHLEPGQRRNPRRGSHALNCGNFIVFLAGCGLLERVTFVCHPDWQDDYNSIYMKGFDPASKALQLKRCSKEVAESACRMLMPLANFRHEVENETPFIRVSRDCYIYSCVPDEVYITRSPGYTPADADVLFNRITQHIDTT